MMALVVVLVSFITRDGWPEILSAVELAAVTLSSNESVTEPLLPGFWYVHMELVFECFGMAFCERARKYVREE